MAISPARALILGLLAAAVAAGCSQSAISGDNEASAQELPASDISPVDRDQVKEGGTMRWPLQGYPLQWNYLHVTGNNAATAELIGAMMPRLWRHDETGVPKPNPDYLTGAEVTENDPEQVVTYTLNPGAKWSDGTPITWRDFQSQFRAMNGRDPRFQSASATGYDRMESVTKGANKHEVVVRYAQPFGDWRAMFDPLYPASTTGDPDVFNNGWLGRAPVTAGPFRHTSSDRKNHTITVERDESFWGNRAKLDRIIYRALSPRAELKAFLNGTLTFMHVGADAKVYRKVEGRPGVDLRKAPAPDYSVITLNGARPPLSDVRVRKAIAMGIDRPAVVDAVLRGFEWSAVPMDNHFYVNTQAGYQDNGGELGDHDPEAAGALLDKAGWTLGQGDRFRTKNGETLTLEWPNPSGSPRSKQIGRLVKGMLGEIGIRLATREVPAADYFDKYVTQGRFDLAPSAWSGTPYPVSFSRSIYAAPRQDADGLVASKNFAQVGSHRIDTLIESSVTALDPDRARELANQADAAIWQEVHSLPLYQRLQVRATDNDLANFGANGFQTVVYENIGFTK